MASGKEGGREEGREGGREGMERTLVEGDHGLGLALAVDVGHDVHHRPGLDLEDKEGRREEG